jgi:hypothetical protein
VVFPATFDPASPAIDAGTVYHYNTLRPADAAWSRGSALSTSSYADFQGDPPWSRLAGLRHPIRAIVLVAPRVILLHRMAARDVIEPTLSGGASQYPRGHWQAIARAVDLNVLYLRWCAELEGNGIEFSLVDSSDYAYRPMSRADLRSRDLNAGELPPNPSLQRTPAW